MYSLVVRPSGIQRITTLFVKSGTFTRVGTICVTAAICMTAGLLAGIRRLCLLQLAGIEHPYGGKHFTPIFVGEKVTWGENWIANIV